MSYDTQRPYLASFVLLENEDGKIAFVLRTNTAWMNGHYGLPSGKVEKGESFTQAALREAKEEAGVTVALKDLHQIHVMHRHEIEDPDNDWIDMFFQASMWSGKAHNAEPDKHGELVWFELDDLPENVVPAVRYALEQIEDGKSYSEYNWEKK